MLMTPTRSNLKVSIVDDHAIFAEGFKQLLSSKFSSLKIVGVYQGGNSLLDDFIRNPADVIFMDIDMPEMNGYDTTQKVLSMYPNAKVIALTCFSDVYSAERMFKAGAVGYATKSMTPTELENIFECIKKDEVYFMPEIAMKYAKHRVVNSVEGNAKNHTEDKTYTNREMQVMRYIAAGKGDKEIGSLLGVSRKTIEADKRKICQKMGVKKAAEIVFKACELGLIPQ